MAVVVTCILLLALWSTGSAQTLPPLERTGLGEGAAHVACDDCSIEVPLSPSFPFGDYCHDKCYIGVNGIISFGKTFQHFSPELLPGSFAAIFYAYVVAPFWADADLRRQGNITWEIHSLGGSEAGDAYLDQVSVFLENREGVNFDGNWMMILDFEEIPPYHAFSLILDLNLPNNTFQVVLISDGRKSYAIYTYKCGAMGWGNKAVVGFNAAGTYYANYNASGSSTVARIACLALPEEVNNVVYDLVPDPNNLQCTSSTPPPPISLGTCSAAGYTACCATNQSNSCLGQPQDCFCDPSCYLYNDCCRDIEDVCLPEPYTGGNETYLLFANSFHINRVTLDGSSFEILYSDPSSSGIVGLDYHYKKGYMYWSDVRAGSLHRAFLNGSNAEVLLVSDGSVIDDLAVDWVNDKLYWTEATHSEISVMDITTRQTTKLIVNYDGSTTRAISVDPTTRYMYWSDWGDEARIERAGMDGSNRTILHNTDLIWPNGITIDYANQKIYWIDANLDTLEYSNVDGTGRTLLERVDDEIFHPFSITLEKEFLFWTDWSRLAIFTTHKDLPNDNIISLYDALVDPPHGIEAVTPDRQMDAVNPCDSVTCDSSSLCLLSPNPEGYSCVCAENCTDDLTPSPPPTSTPSTPTPSTPTITTTITPSTPPITQVPGGVRSLQAVNVSANELKISWEAPQSGGIADFYLVTVSTSEGVVFEDDTEDLFTLVDELEPEVPYYVTVVAVNSIGAGDAQSVIAFTKEGTPSVAPAVSTVWTSLTDLEVSWIPLTLEEARGFIRSYAVTLTSGGDRRKKRAVEVEEVPGDQTSISFPGLDSNREYSVSVAAETAAGVGVSSEPVSAPSAGYMFQLHFLDISNCEDWQTDGKKDAIVLEIIGKLVTNVNVLCVACNLEVFDVTNGVIECEEDSNTATFRAFILGNINDNEATIDTIKKWVEQGGNLSIDGSTVKLNSACEVAIESFEDALCEPPTPPGTSAVSPTTQSDVASIVVPVVIIVMLVILVVVLIVIVIMFWLRKRQKDGPYLNFEETPTARLSYTPAAERRDCANPIYDDEKTYPLEEEYFEDPDILK